MGLLGTHGAPVPAEIGGVVRDHDDTRRQIAAARLAHAARDALKSWADLPDFDESFHRALREQTQDATPATPIQ